MGDRIIGTLGAAARYQALQCGSDLTFDGRELFYSKRRGLIGHESPLNLNDPAYFGKMSELLDEIIEQRRADALSYEEYLKKVEELARKVATGQADSTPSELDTPGKRALYNNLLESPAAAVAEAQTYAGKDPVVALAERIHRSVMEKRPADWRGVTSREQVIKEALYDELNNIDEVERIFTILKQQPEY